MAFIVISHDYGAHGLWLPEVANNAGSQDDQTGSQDEMKQSEGDPQIKGKIRQKQRQMAMAYEGKCQADIIVLTRPICDCSPIAGMSAPLVVAKDRIVAQHIERSHVRPHVDHREQTARACHLCGVQIDDRSAGLYQAVLKCWHASTLETCTTPGVRKTVEAERTSPLRRTLIHLYNRCSQNILSFDDFNI